MVEDIITAGVTVTDIITIMDADIEADTIIIEDTDIIMDVVIRHK